jgi:prepilin-type N-terminal cleavage/methylation domain-containing protein
MNLMAGSEEGRAVASSIHSLPPSTLHPPTLPVRRRGFTLIELLVVITIMVILATLAVAAAFKVKQTNQLKVARTSGYRLAQAIEAYKDLQGYLPLQVLYDAETDADDVYENWDLVWQLNGVMNRGELLDITSAEKNASGSFKDPWRQPYRVVVWKEKPADALNRYFQVYSCGPNMKWEHGRNDPTAVDKPDDIAPRH